VTFCGIIFNITTLYAIDIKLIMYIGGKVAFLFKKNIEYHMTST